MATDSIEPPTMPHEESTVEEVNNSTTNGVISSEKLNGLTNDLSVKRSASESSNDGNPSKVAKLDNESNENVTNKEPLTNGSPIQNGKSSTHIENGVFDTTEESESLAEKKGI